jgi:hypothetical protein
VNLVNLTKEFVAACAAAFEDTAQNIFRPAHNLKVAFGILKEPSITEQIEAKRTKLGLNAREGIHR